MLRRPQGFKVRSKVKGGPKIGALAMSLISYGGFPTLRRGGGGANQKRPKNGRIGYVTHVIRGAVANVAGLETKAKVGNNWAHWRRQRFRLAGSATLGNIRQNQKWPIMGQIGCVNPAVWGSPTLQSGGENRKGAASERIIYITIAVCYVC